ncbi:MAG: ethanolamine ammonia-lyase subunit EutC [Clostridium sp.]|uniref:ethanolamine ammonia-lyase subunit EutC n=1 Tax=Clostridium culturomicium TaxID=1499683 RepID=UPI00058B871E|nr:ethanolamine ammonia-lyase subunit EutC [Clostridium culturomicium]MDU4890295.1 ethanolamine ammonia-lyase subunit EutC [Clostridium sp.]MDU7084263.1 ethanolamine ammonia-lyase subunit EutC [Clostridium sp.]
MNEQELKSMVEKLLVDMIGKAGVNNIVNEVTNKVSGASSVDENGCIPDITEIDLKTQLLVENPHDREGYLKMKQRTPARIGIGRSGPRYKTITQLRVRADHAAAQDSVFSYVDEDFIKANGLIPVNTMCHDKDEYLTRPDLGRRFDEETTKFIKDKFSGQKVLLVVGDGLSSAAIEANIKEIIPAIKQGLKMYGIEIGDILFVKHARVGAMDAIGDATGAEVVCILVGERPGLVTAESMSAYIAYKPTANMPEANRTVISNIHKGGTTAVEAGAHVAELIKLMLDKKASGINLKI